MRYILMFHGIHHWKYVSASRLWAWPWNKTINLSSECMAISMAWLASIPGSPMREQNCEKGGEPGIFCHVRNVTFNCVWAIKTASHVRIYYNSIPVHVVLICIADSAIMLPHTTQQPYYSCSKTPELHQVLCEMPRRPFHGLAEKLPN